MSANLHKLFCFFILFITAASAAFSQGRNVIGLNGYWQFSKGTYTPGSADTASAKWQTVSLPHSWNKDDVDDDTPGYYRGLCWYKKAITVNSDWQNKKVFIFFEGANQQTAVYVNGHKAGEHTGGYTRFCIEIGQFLDFKPGAKNEIAVSVDNSFNENIPPLTADFTFFGGIYRDVNLVICNKTHFDLSHASTGVYITTPTVSATNALVKINGQITTKSDIKQKLQIVTTILDRSSKMVADKKIFLSGNNTELNFAQDLPIISNPHLWSTDDPYLYTVITKIVDAKSGDVIDEVANPLGLRWFKFDGEKGFFLNGKPLKLMGASRHQDFKELANALPDSYHIHDMELLKAMGANFLRVSHYPQDPMILEMCDKLGILASVEIPVVNAITESAAFTANCKNMQVEMIRQNYNHPSVVIWAYMNEVLLRPKFNNDKPRQQIYFANIAKLAGQLDSVTRKEDPNRYTMIANHGDFNRYKQVGLIQIPMLVGWNLYQGWYGGTTAGFAEFLDKHHKEFPDKPLLVTEFGADADPRIRSSQPERFDKSLEYAVGFHQVYLNAIKARPFVAAAAVWNLVDFNSETREETMPHINNKGLLTQDRKPKDVYSLYQAYLLNKPFIKISNWNIRAGITDSLNSSVCTQPISVFTNEHTIQLTVNGTRLPDQQVKDGEATWQVPFIKGLNRVEALITVDGKTYADIQDVNFNLLSRDLKNDRDPLLNINVLLGAKRFYVDEAQHQVWMPDQPYRTGNFGYVGGHPFSMPGNGQQSYGTNKNILNTDNDPIYQTQQVGIQQYRFDVPDGEYELVLHFAELTTNKTKEALAYNLTNNIQKEKAEERVFNVTVNNQSILKNFSPANTYGTLTAGQEKIQMIVTGGKGIMIAFEPLKGEAILNAIQLRKM
ncbi:glycoside hydrolase family 2 TIM barrel-domain containing protein [Mucilaginibacter sp. SG564]|uniref:glycoside hydrolase family 2 TIM barrel-domain containing protein n=1 Tax=Mucilaginibacter sp. SG564 TaxID=2587022 RepID=UPI0015533B3A|nr:glycoside hydrolase family 2 TIM barrel-domain containing protein [Mucilaginibacter sp. SG564]NOW93428.1 beta-galactosidase [Mucilaginibacter sp. SG564]